MKSLRESLLDTTPEDDITAGVINDDGTISNECAPYCIDKNGVFNVPYGCTTIRTNQFHSNKNIKSIIFPSTIEKISDYAFANCINLKSIKFPNPIRKLRIGIGSFSYCRIEEVNIPEGVEEMGMNCFPNNPIKTICIPKSIKEIGAWAFQDCEDLETVDFQSRQIQVLQKATFSGCRKLRSIELPDTIQFLHDRVFQDSGIREIKAPGVLRVYNNVFTGCKELQEVTLADGVNLDNRSFKNCRQLKKNKFNYQGSVRKNF